MGPFFGLSLEFELNWVASYSATQAMSGGEYYTKPYADYADRDKRH